MIYVNSITEKWVAIDTVSIEKGLNELVLPVLSETFKDIYITYVCIEPYELVYTVAIENSCLYIEIPIMY